MVLEVNFSASNNEIAVDFESINNVSDGGYEKGYEQGYEDGYKEASSDNYYDIFWDCHQLSGKRVMYNNTFSGVAYTNSLANGGAYDPNYKPWNDLSFKPKYDMKPLQAQHMFSYCNITDLVQCLDESGVTLDFSECTTLQNLFRNASGILRIPPIDVTNAKTLVGAFGVCTLLKSIEIRNLQSTCVFDNGTFITDASLEELIIDGVIGVNGFNVSYCTKLSHDSLLNILNILEDKTEDTSGTTWKITLGSTNKSKLTDEELQIAYDKGWEVA